MTRLYRLATHLASATGFLTRLPIPARLQSDPPVGARAAWAYPLAATIAVFLPALILVLFIELGAGALLSALLAISTSLLVTGGLHEDGLADAADGLFGGQTREAALEIMKDSCTGAYGTLAIVVSVTLRATALAMLVPLGAKNAALLFIAAAAAGRTAMVCQWCASPPAKSDGVAVTLGRPAIRDALWAVALCIILVGLFRLSQVLLCLHSLPRSLWPRPVLASRFLSPAVLAVIQATPLGQPFRSVRPFSSSPLSFSPETRYPIRLDVRGRIGSACPPVVLDKGSD
nr:adenosylcobinamide-GDP ribazoletransferase [Marinicella sp. W31]MDC2876634.1 adenosylcobinamide-GDP ribazoletransferase [Marinicella sp. W31]